MKDESYFMICFYLVGIMTGIKIVEIISYFK